MVKSTPLVSIVTPVYNSSRFLEECIQSVLRQSYENWEYLIVNNCSTDDTDDIANRYAKLDERIRVIHCKEFLDVIENHNRSLRLISPNSKYCKVIPADDGLFPECISKMVEFAEGKPSVGIVGSYSLSGSGTQWRVKFDGLPYASTVVSGHEASRWHLLGGRHYLGCQASVLYRAELVRSTDVFYPNARQHADISAFYKYLQCNDLGFIHQILTFERIHMDQLGAKARKFSTYAGSHLLDVLEYGPIYLTREELTNRIHRVLHDYYYAVGVGLINFKGRKFWNYHKGILVKAGARHYRVRVVCAVFRKLVDIVCNPKLTVEKLLCRYC